MIFLKKNLFFKYKIWNAKYRLWVYIFVTNLLSKSCTCQKIFKRQKLVKFKNMQYIIINPTGNLFICIVLFLRFSNSLFHLLFSYIISFFPFLLFFQFFLYLAFLLFLFFFLSFSLSVFLFFLLLLLLLAILLTLLYLSFFFFSFLFFSPSLLFPLLLCSPLFLLLLPSSPLFPHSLLLIISFSPSLSLFLPSLSPSFLC